MDSEMLQEYKEQEIIYPKSNQLIDSKYRSTITEQKILAVALNELTQHNYVEKDGLSVTIPASVLRNYLGDKTSGTFYEKLSQASRSLTGRVLGMDNGTSEFHYMTVITNAHYVKGMLTITFNAGMKNYLLGMKGNFTKLSLSEQLSYKSVYALRIAELLKRRMYVDKDAEPRNRYKITFGKSEFFLMIGLCNSELAEVRRILDGSNGGTADYDKALEKSPEKLYGSISDLKKRVIKPAVEEINLNPLNKIHIDDVEYTKAGRGGRIIEIIFYVTKVSSVVETEVPFKELDKDEFLDMLSDLLPEYKLRLKEQRAIAETSKWNLERCEKAIDVLRKSTGVNNVVGFLVEAIKNNWSEPIVQSEKDTPLYKQFAHREDEGVDLEKELLCN